jgi:hypothetical protein
MTVNQLHKLLTKLIAQGHGRKSVYVDKGSYRDPREADGCVILPVYRGAMHTYRLLDEDGGTWINADGTERQRTSLVLIGDAGSTWKEHMPPEPRRSSKGKNVNHG